MTHDDAQCENKKFLTYMTGVAGPVEVIWCRCAERDYKETREELQRVLGLLMDQDEKVERLTAALRATAPLVCPHDGHTLGCCCECRICAERQKALTEPGGQP